MILKIEQWTFLPEEPPDKNGPYDPTKPPPKNKRRVFHMIDHVENVRFGEVVPITGVPHPMPKDDGTVTEVEMYLHDGHATRPEGPLMVNLIYFDQGGRAPRVVACEGNVYLCNDGGDTIEVIRDPN